jgi:glucosamine-6-phosphate deaminase
MARHRSDVPRADVTGRAAAQGQAIFKHQSQKDSAPFPGQDEREFWQRVEQRNKDTAAVLDRLGLAEYFAMEAYVVD